MSVESNDVKSRASVGARPLPPTYSLDTVTGKFTGSAQPGVSVKVFNSTDKKTHAVIADADGNWTVDLGQAPRWYSVFQLWAESADDSAMSEKLGFVVGGKNLKMADLYVGETSAFGVSSKGSKILIFGPDGIPVGRKPVQNKAGGWFLKFRKPLRAGDQVCVVAIQGDTGASLPTYATVQSFSVDETGLDRFAGSGANPDDGIEFFDAASGAFVGTTHASATGAWSMTFANAVKDGVRLFIRRVHSDGTISSGPTILASRQMSWTTTPTTPIPRIDGISNGSKQVWGTSNPNDLILLSQYRNGVSVLGTEKMGYIADATGRWYGPGEDPRLDLYPGDVLTVTSTGATGNATSAIYNAAVYVNQSTKAYGGLSRPFTPVIQQAGTGGIAGWGDPEGKIAIATNSLGLVDIVTPSEINATWTFSSFGDFNSGDIIFTEQILHYGTQSTSLTSHVNGIQLYDPNDPGRQVPDTPVITSAPDGTFYAGTEQTPNTEVKVFDFDMGEVEVSNGPMPVTNGQWSGPGNPDIPASTGDEIRAKAYALLSDGSEGATSNWSNPYYIGQPTQTVRAVPPEIDAVTPAGVATGTTLVGTGVTIYIDDQPVSPWTVSTDGKFSIQCDPSAGAMYTVVNATASYPDPNDNSEPSSVSSDRYYLKNGQMATGLFQINSVTTTTVTGVCPPYQYVMGWDLDTGALVLQEQIGSSGSFSLNFKTTLASTALVYFTAAGSLKGDGSMQKYDTKPVGYINSR